MDDKAVFGLLFLLKFIKIGLSYAALLIAKNITSQIYSEKVYVKQQSPPNLSNMLLLFLGIEVVFTVITLGLIGVLIGQAMGGFGPETNGALGKLAVMFSQYYICYLISMAVHGFVLANTMTNKKYFLYKDDGLRAIRALSDVLLQYSIANGLVPFHLIFVGLMSTLKEFA